MEGRWSGSWGWALGAFSRGQGSPSVLSPKAGPPGDPGKEHLLAGCAQVWNQASSGLSKRLRMPSHIGPHTPPALCGPPDERCPPSRGLSGEHSVYKQRAPRADEQWGLLVWVLLTSQRTSSWKHEGPGELGRVGFLLIENVPQLLGASGCTTGSPPSLQPSRTDFIVLFSPHWVPFPGEGVHSVSGTLVGVGAGRGERGWACRGSTPRPGT